MFILRVLLSSNLLLVIIYSFLFYPISYMSFKEKAQMPINWTKNNDKKDEDGCCCCAWKGNDVFVVTSKSRKRSRSAAISHRSSGAVVTPPQPSSSAVALLLPPLIDLINNTKIGGLTGEEHDLFLHGLELHRKGSLVSAIPVVIAPILELINISGNTQDVDGNSQVDCDTQGVNKMFDFLFC